MNVISVEDLKVKIGTKEILQNVSFQVQEGTIYGIVGHNGAGKTTLLKVLLGLIPKYSGSILLYESRELSAQRAGIGAVMDVNEIDQSCTAKEYLRRICMMSGQNDRNSVTELLQKVGLGECGGMTIRKFSLGMKRRLLIACALAGNPRLLILDEPFNGIDPRGMSELRVILQMLVSEGTTIVVTSHIIPELIKLANVFGVMARGKVVAEITSQELSTLKKDKTVIKIHNPLPFIEKMRKAHPDHCCMSDAPGEVSVFGSVTYEEIQDVCAECKIVKEDFGHSFMTEEELLLWRMEGFEE